MFPLLDEGDVPSVVYLIIDPAVEVDIEICCVLEIYSLIGIIDGVATLSSFVNTAEKTSESAIPVFSAIVFTVVDEFKTNGVE